MNGKTMLDPFTVLINLAETAIDKIFPDATARELEKRKLATLKKMGDLQALQAYVDITLSQIEVNKTQATHKSLFVAGARPAAIWVGVAAMAYSGILHPSLTWLWAFCNFEGPTPPLPDSSALMAIVSGLLGVGVMRSFDKTKGTQTDSIT